MESRILSIEEANQMLPLLRQIVGDVMETWEKIIYKRTRLECIEKGLDLEGEEVIAESRDSKAQELKLELNHLIERINSYIREVEELGCFVEEFKRGIVNFPSLYNGRKVFLCWKPEEDEVLHWHELDETFNDRTPIRDTREFLCHQPRVEN